MAPRSLRVLIPDDYTPSREGVLLCQGLPRPVRAAEWGHVMTLRESSPVLALSQEERAAFREVEQAWEHRNETGRVRWMPLDKRYGCDEVAVAAAETRLRETKARHATTVAALHKAIVGSCMLVDLSLGYALIPGDSPELVFVRRSGVVEAS